MLLLLADNAREALAAAVRMRRGGANAWAAAVGRVGRVGSRRRRGADIFSSGLCVRASPWGRPPIQRVYSERVVLREHAAVREHVRRKREHGSSGSLLSWGVGSLQNDPKRSQGRLNVIESIPKAYAYLKLGEHQPVLNQC